mgnify:CR=1 FL=1
MCSRSYNENIDDSTRLFWWKIEHVLPYHGEIIEETRYISASNLLEVIDVMKTNIHPDRVDFDFDSIKFTKVTAGAVEKDKVWSLKSDKGQLLKTKLISIALEWQKEMGVAPAITPIISELDAAKLVGCSYENYCQDGIEKTAVTKGYDFIYKKIRYQVKACRPSGKKGSKITKVPKAKNYEWDKLIWILYDEKYNVLEAWLWDVDKYKEKFDYKSRISPEDMRNGTKIF